MRKEKTAENSYSSLILDIKGNIRKTRYLAMRSANRELLLLYYHIGRSLSDRVRSEEWGSKILERISSDIQQEFSGIRGFSVRNLKKMRQFFMEYHYLKDNLSLGSPVKEHSFTNVGGTEIVPPVEAQLDEDQIGPTLSAQLNSIPPREFINTFMSLGFSHHILLLVKCQEIEERYFYMCQSMKGQWSFRVLEYHIESNLYRGKGKLLSNFQQNLSDDIGTIQKSSDGKGEIP